MPHPLFAHFGHQMELCALIAPLALLPKLATRLHHCIATLPWIALLALSVSIELISSLARVTSVKSYKRLGVCLFVCDGHPDPKIGPQVYLGPIKMGLGPKKLHLWPQKGQFWAIGAEKRMAKRPNNHIPDNQMYPGLPQEMGKLWFHWAGSVWPQNMGVIWV